MQELSKSVLFKRLTQYVSIILMLFNIVILFVSLVNPALARQMSVAFQIIQLVAKIAEFLIEDFQSRRTFR